MPGNNDPSRIYRDPALTDRRGDATGPVALLFLVIVIGAFAAVTWGLVTYLPVAADPTPRPTPTATAPGPTPTPVATAAPRPSTEPGASLAPSISPEPSTTSEPGATDGPTPTRRPRETAQPRESASPEPAATPRPPRTGTIGEAIPVVRDGRREGTVTMVSFAAGEVAGVDVPSGGRIMVMEVTYTSPTTGMVYNAARWQIVETDGTRHPSLGNKAPAPVLGRGRLDPGGSVTGNVAFIRERGMLIESIVLTDADGNDLVVIERPPVP